MHAPMTSLGSFSRLHWQRLNRGWRIIPYYLLALATKSPPSKLLSVKPLFVGLPKIMARYKTPFMLAFIVLLATALRVYQIDRESFWLDEAFSYWVANSTPADIVRTSANEQNPPFTTSSFIIGLSFWVTQIGQFASYRRC